MAWTVVESIVSDARYGTERKVSVQLACISDAAGTLSHALTIGGLRGLFLYALETDPDGTTPPTSNYTITVVDEFGMVLLTTGALTAANHTYTKGDTTVGVLPLIGGKPTITCTSPGDTKKLKIILLFVSG